MSGRRLPVDPGTRTFACAACADTIDAHSLDEVLTHHDWVYRDHELLHRGCARKIGNRRRTSLQRFTKDLR